MAQMRNCVAMETLEGRDLLTGAGVATLGPPLVDTQHPAIIVSSKGSAADVGTLVGRQLFKDALSAGGDTDSYTFRVPATQAFVLHLDRLSGDADAAILDSNGAVIASSRGKGLSAEGINLTLSEGTYSARVEQRAGNGATYRLSLAVAPEATVFQYPLGDGHTPPTITGKFGGSAMINGKEVDGHLAEDVHADFGTRVNVIGSGVVTQVIQPGDPDYRSTWGRVVIVQHAVPGLNSPIYSMYAHLSEVDVTESEPLPPGTMIGASGHGDDNNPYPPHLHYEIRADTSSSLGAATLAGNGYAHYTFDSDVVELSHTAYASNYPFRWFRPSTFIANRLSTTGQPPTIPAPTITGVDPAQPEALDGRQLLTIRGTGFDPAEALVYLYDPAGHKFRMTAGRISSRDASHVTTNPNFTSAGAGTWQAEIVNPDGQSSGPFAFTVVAATPPPTIPAPTITGVDPAQPRATDGRQAVTFGGANFDSGAYVVLYDPAGNAFTLSGDRVTARSATAITVNPNFTSAGAGTWQAVVVDGNGQSSDRFSFTVR